MTQEKKYFDILKKMFQKYPTLLGKMMRIEDSSFIVTFPLWKVYYSFIKKLEFD